MEQFKKSIEEVQAIQEVLDKRTEIENQAMALITQGHYRTAIELLKSTPGFPEEGEIMCDR